MDARSRRSIEALRRALLDLVMEKPLEDVSIRDIAGRAGVSYPTFFRHYASKNEVLESIATEEVRRLLDLGQATFAETGSAEVMCRYIHAHRPLWSVLLNGGAADAMRGEFMRISHEIAAVRPRYNQWLPIELSVPFVTSGIFEIMSWWMRQPEDYPLDKVIRLFDVLIVEAFAASRDIRI